MAAVARSTPNFTLPATQNTAPVYEFRCLYTHDVRKKAKKWHDGSAKFHTFNKRVMVYDDTKSYIGDLHYRADEEFGEGIELRLDRGVLVEVGERVGETQTDLTGIVNNRCSDGISPSAAAHAQPRVLHRVNHLNGHGKLRSLTEMLGTSQSRNGRMNLHIVSPFEQRQALSEVQSTEPPAKRQRTSLGKENVYSMDRSKNQSPTTNRSTSSICAANCPTAPSTRNILPVTTGHHFSDRRIIDISSDGESAQEPDTSTSRTQTPRAQTTAFSKSTPHNSKTQLLGARESGSQRKVQSNQCDPLIELPRQGAASCATAKSTRMDSDDTSGSSLRAGMSSLKMRSQRPRRKLMYRALLPCHNRKETEVGTDVQTNDQPKDVDSTDTLLQDRCSLLLSSKNDRDEIFGLGEDGETDLPSIPVGTLDSGPQTPARSSSQSNMLQCSPLFVSQSFSQKSPTPLRTFAEDDFHVPTTQEPGLQLTPVVDNAELSHTLSTTQRHATPEPESPCFPVPPTRLEPTGQTSLPSMPPPDQLPSRLPGPIIPAANQHTPSPSKARTFARSLSANDSPLLHDPRATPTPGTKNLAPIDHSPIVFSNYMAPLHPPLLPLPASYRNSLSPSKSPLQRSRSDTAAIIPTAVVPLTAIAAVATEEQGPWTSLEAFLLFDKWPECKQKFKPAFEALPQQFFGNDYEIDDENDGFGIGLVSAGKIGNAKAPPVFIRSARSFLRDG